MAVQLGPVPPINEQSQLKQNTAIQQLFAALQSLQTDVMGLEQMFYRKSFYHIQRVGNGLAGTYLAIDPTDITTPGGAWFITDPPGSLPTGSFPYPLPTWMPRQVYISRALVAYPMTVYFSDPTTYATLTDQEKQNSPTLLINKKGIDNQAFIGGSEATADFTRDVSLIQYQTADPVVFIERDYNVPILWDRDAGDLLMLSVALSQKINWLYSEIQFLVPFVKPVVDTGGTY